jgi:hypothetical protein
MEINQFILDGKKSLTLHLTTKEAVALIKSLSSQITEESSNSGRQEVGNAKLFISHKNKKAEIHKGVYFSAFVRLE